MEAIQHYFSKEEWNSPHDDTSGPPGRIQHHLRTVTAKLTSIFGQNGTDQSPQLPLSGPRNRASTQTIAPTGLPTQTTAALYLLTCFNSSRMGIRLDQEVVHDIHSDKDLFARIQSLYVQRRGFLFSAMSLKTPVGIDFVEVRNPALQLIETIKIFISHNL